MLEGVSEQEHGLFAAARGAVLEVRAAEVRAADLRREARPDRGGRPLLDRPIRGQRVEQPAARPARCRRVAPEGRRDNARVERDL